MIHNLLFLTGDLTRRLINLAKTLCIGMYKIEFSKYLSTFALKRLKFIPYLTSERSSDSVPFCKIPIPVWILVFNGTDGIFKNIQNMNNIIT